MVTVMLFGFVFGFAGSMPPMGPISVLVISRSIEGRFRSGFIIGAGAAVAEASYAALAFWGFSAVLARHAWVVPVSHIVAALLLTALGLTLLLRRRLVQAAAPRERSAGNLFLGFTISALNPTFLATWTAAMTVLYSTELVELSPSHALPFALAVLAGIVSWWAVLVSLLRKYRGRFRETALAGAMRVMGVVLVVMGLWFAWDFLHYVVRVA
jgi:threonine/homoserine/homoserine lactone efflux protein